MDTIALLLVGGGLALTGVAFGGLVASASKPTTTNDNVERHRTPQYTKAQLLAAARTGAAVARAQTQRIDTTR